MWRYFPRTRGAACCLRKLLSPCWLQSFSSSFSTVQGYQMQRTCICGWYFFYGRHLQKKTTHTVKNLNLHTTIQWLDCCGVNCWVVVKTSVCGELSVLFWDAGSSVTSVNICIWPLTEDAQTCIFWISQGFLQLCLLLYMYSVRAWGKHRCVNKVQLLFHKSGIQLFALLRTRPPCPQSCNWRSRLWAMRLQRKLEYQWSTFYRWGEKLS